MMGSNTNGNQLQIASEESEKIQSLRSTADAQMDLYRALRSLVHLNAFIDTLEQLTSLLEEADSKARACSNLGAALLSRFRMTDAVGDIKKAISAGSQALELTPEQHPDRHRRLNTLANALEACFDRLGDLPALDKAISLKKNALARIAEGHKDRAACLNNLGNALQTRFERLDDLQDLEQSIVAKQDALDLTSDGNVDRSMYLDGLGSVLLIRFQRLDDVKDLDRAVSCIQQASTLPSERGYDGVSILNNLGSALQIRFSRTGVLQDLDKAISVLQNVVRLTPKGHCHRARHLNALGSALSARFRRLDDVKDLNTAISLKKDAVALTLKEHPDRPMYLNNLGNALQFRFARVHVLEDLHEAISAHQEAASLTPEGHPDKPMYLNGLGGALRTRFERLHDLKDIDRAISVKRDAVTFSPDGHRDRPAYLSSLGQALETRFKQAADPQRVDLDQAISAQQDAVDIVPEGHAERPTYLSTLAYTMTLRYAYFPEDDSLRGAISVMKASATAFTGQPTTRFRSARDWARLCFLDDDLHSAMDAFSAMLSLVPQIAWLGRPISKRYEDIHKIGDAVNEAAAFALQAGQHQMALEWLEEGRSIVWGQLVQLRTPADELRTKHPELANNLEQISARLENAAMGSSLLNKEVASLEDEAQAHRRLAEKWKLAVDSCRVPGFEDFLRPSKFSKLSGASAHGTIVVLNVHEIRCDALILPHHCEKLIHVPLTSFTYSKAVNLRRRMNGLLHEAHIRLRATALGSPADLERILSVLWADVVRPIFKALALQPPVAKTASASLPRIFWCATGPLASMPLHAAGDYTMDGLEHRAYNFAVSSYIPTLMTLLQSSDNKPGDFRGIFAVSESSTLPGTIREIDGIEEHVGITKFTRLNNEIATKAAVLNGMAEHSWIHLACHAVQNQGDPLKSCFKLHGGNLELREIMHKSFKHGGLAFLSACQTATGHDDLPEEAIHLAAGMLSAGYSTVLATMWSIQDEDAPSVAKDVYSRLIDKVTGAADARRAAWALHEATANLREKIGETNVARWVPFIHMGV